MIENKEDILLALNYFQELINPSWRYEIDTLNDRFKNNDSDSFESNDTSEVTEFDLEKWQNKNTELGKEIINIIENGIINKLVSAWQSKLYNILLKEKNSAFIEKNSPSKITLGENSKYYNDIHLEKAPIRGKLLLWQEEYLTGNYKKALDICNSVRLDYDCDNSKIYEYLMLSFLKACDSDVIISSSFNTKDESLFKKLLLYVERVQGLAVVSSTRENSLEEVYLLLLKSINKIYQNINYDYAYHKPARGISKKRELIKKIIETVLLLADKFGGKPAGFIDFCEDLLIELEGGGKYFWIYPIRNGLSNKIRFDAVGYREKVMKLLNFEEELIKKQEHISYLISSLKVKSSKLSSSANKNNAKRELILSCELGFILYQDERFKKLKEGIFNEVGLDDFDTEVSTRIEDLEGDELKSAYEDATKGININQNIRNLPSDSKNADIGNSEFTSDEKDANTKIKRYWLLIPILELITDIKNANKPRFVSFILSLVFLTFLGIWGGIQEGIYFPIILFIVLMTVVFFIIFFSKKNKNYITNTLKS